MKFYQDSHGSCGICPVGEEFTKLGLKYGECPFNMGGYCRWENVEESQKFEQLSNEFFSASNTFAKELKIKDDKINELNSKIKYLKEIAEVFLIEDGSVDLEELDKRGIDYIVYRQGSNPPALVKNKHKNA